MAHVLPEYPRPQLVRDSYLNLNGPWDHAITDAERHDVPLEWDGEIVVPFSPEAPLSGVNRRLLPAEALWYRRTVELPDGFVRDRVLLHFGAVDQDCEVWVNGRSVGSHRGGYLPFAFDITEALGAASGGEVVVRVRDVTDTSHRSRGKQSLNPRGIWYSPQSGIWQTVWLESVPETWIERLVLTPHLDTGEVEVDVVPGGEGSGIARVEIFANGVAVAESSVHTGESARLQLGGAVRAWCPEDPFLYDVRVKLGDDDVRSYVAMRSFGRGPDAHGVSRLLLNGKPYLHAGLLDQGYWPDGLYTAPTDAALAYDVEVAKELGFTMLRKHIKIEPLRWYHHCDRLGMLVWQDMVNGGTTYRREVVTIPVVAPVGLRDNDYRRFGRDDAEGRAEFLAEVDATVELLRSVPSVACWVPFNEGWGQFDANEVAARVRALDPTRLVDHASGWHEQGGGDIASRHVYGRRYRVARADVRDARVAVLSEYGGYSHRVAGHCWSEEEFGYRRFPGRFAFERAFLRLHHEEIGPAIEAGLGGFVYTQLSDVERETNGLLTYDRAVVKIDPEVVRTANKRLRQRFDHAVGGAVGGPRQPLALREREITEPVDLTRPSGHLHPDAVGWTRRPLHRTDGVRDLGWGRTKRWEYWAITTPTHIVALTVSDLDYAAVHALWLLDRRTGETISHEVTALPRSVRLPGTLGEGPTTARTRRLSIEHTELAGGTRLRASGPRVSVDVVAALPAGHERLGLVVPWSAREFQYTVKDVARPASGTITVDGVEFPVPAGDSWAALDHGRGRWPYAVQWNWGAGAGRTHGHVVGVQVGGRWTDGTGSVENAVVVDGRLSKISEELVWEYSTRAPDAPWRVWGEAADLSFTPFHVRRARTQLGVVSSHTVQCFGHWAGRLRTDDGTWVHLDDVVGWAEDVRNRW